MPILINAYRKAKDADLVTEKIRERLLEYLTAVGDSMLEGTKEMQEFISMSLKSLSKAIAGDMSSGNLLLCSMDKCIDLTIRRYPFKEGERELIKWNRKTDFKFMGNEILMIASLSNLIKNSLEQIRINNKGKIFITTEIGDNGNILHIKDTAGGVPPERIEHLFDGYKTTKVGGTGIGLASCKKTMKDFGRDIICHSQYGDFIEFTLTFPKVIEAGLPL
jgi:signal transduction histidine kinase